MINIPNLRYWTKFVFGTVVAFTFGTVITRYMDDEHDHYVIGQTDETRFSRRKRLQDKSYRHNWFESCFFLNKDGLALFWRRWLPNADSMPSIRGIVVICHGLGEHSGRYEVIARELNKIGFAVYAFDLQGHGQSEGTRHFVKAFNDYIIDLHQFTEISKTKHPNVHNVYLLGHSMGGLIAIHAVNEASQLYDGVILSAPPTMLNLHMGSERVLSVISSLFPKMPYLTFHFVKLCRDKSVLDRYYNDPLVNMGPYTVRLISGLVQAALAVSNIISHFETPYLLMHGTGDKICMYAGSKKFHENTVSKDKTFLTYQDAYHELLNEPDCMEQAIPHVIKWIKER